MNPFFSRLWRPLLSAGLGPVLLWLASVAALAQIDRPNMVILLADDLGYGELGCQGNPEIPTPNIDAIAENGVRFTNGYVTAPFCAASRAALLSGRYQTRFGFEFNPIGPKNEAPGIGLPPEEVTLAEHLQDAGYTTGLFGKWHLGGTAEFHPFRHGFDEFFGFLHEGHYFVPPPYEGVTTMLRRNTLPDGTAGRWISPNGKLVYSSHMGHNEPDYDADNPIFRGGQPVVEEEYLTNALTREAVDFIGRNADRPFFLYLAYNAVHSPLQGLDGYMEKFSGIEDIHRRIFAAMLGNLDDSVGTVMAKLREEGLEENTLVVFLSDNGGPTRELTSSNLPLRGEKGQVYDGGLRIPFMMQWPGTLPAGTVYEKPVISLDLYPMAADLANAPVPPDRRLDGVNLLPYLTGEAAGDPHETLFWRVGQSGALRMGDWKLVRLRNPKKRWELYNLAEDIGETEDRIELYPEEAAKLQKAWESYNAQMVEPLW